MPHHLFAQVGSISTSKFQLNLNLLFRCSSLNSPDVEDLEDEEEDDDEEDDDEEPNLPREFPNDKNVLKPGTEMDQSPLDFSSVLIYRIVREVLLLLTL